MTASRVRTALISALLLVAIQATVSADLTFTLTPNLEAGPPGSLLTYSGNLSYTGVNPVFLNDIQITFNGGAGAVLTGDSTIFFNNVPGIFFDGDLYNGPIFGVQISPAAAPLLYSGVATIMGGDDFAANNPLASQTFFVSATPEPATWAMFLLGGVGIVAIARKRREE